MGKYSYKSLSQQIALTTCEMMSRSAAGRAEVEDYTKALKIYMTAVKLIKKWENYPGLFIGDENNLLVAGNCYCGTGQYRTAMQWYKQGLKLFPNSITLNAALGNCAELCGEFTQAVSYYEKCQEIFPFDPEINKTLKACREHLLLRLKDGT